MSTNVGSYPSCDEQDKKMALCFTIAYVLSFVASSVAGYINLKFGTRITRIIVVTMTVSGFLFMAFTNLERPWFIFPGWTLLSVGSVCLFLNNLQVSNLFVVGGPFLIGSLNGTFDSSAAVFLILKVAFEHGVARRNLFFIMISVFSMTFVSTFMIFPRHHIKRTDEGNCEIHVDITNPAFVDENDGTNDSKSMDTDQTKVQKKDGVELEDSPNKKQETMSKMVNHRPKMMSPWRCVAEPMFLTSLAWTSLVMTHLGFYTGTINHYLTDFFNGNITQVSKYTNVCYYFLLGGLFTSAMSGAFYSWLRKRFRDHKSDAYREIFPAVYPLLIATLLSTGLSIMKFVRVEALLYVSFVILVLFRSFLYSALFGFLSTVFPANYSMFLNGFTLMVAGGIFGSLQYAIFEWKVVANDGAIQVNVFLLVLSLVSAIHPCFLWIKCKRQQGTVD